MNKYSYYNNSYTEMYHFGIPGMKWGVHKAETTAEKLYRWKTTAQDTASKIKRNWNDAVDTTKWLRESGQLKFKSGSNAAKRTASSAAGRRMQDHDQARRVNETARKIGSSLKGAYNASKNAVTSTVDRVKNAATGGYKAVNGRLNHYIRTAKAGVNTAFRAAGLEAYQSQILRYGGIALGIGAGAATVAIVNHHSKKKQEKSKK